MRARGYAIDDEEHRYGTRCVAAPIGNAAGRIFAAVSVSGPAKRMTLARIEELSALVRFNADSISAQLGHKPRRFATEARPEAA